MVRNFCKGCGFPAGQLPPCAAYEIAAMISLDGFLAGNCGKETVYPVCPKKAQDISGGRLGISESCDECSMCAVACPSSGAASSELLKKDSSEILQNLNLTNIFLGLLLNTPVASEVKVRGNSRSRRIDIAISHGGEVLLIKVLNSPSRMQFYKRAYEETAAEYNRKLPDLNFRAAFLLPDKVYESLKDKTDGCFFTVKSIYEYFKGE